MEFSQKWMLLLLYQIFNILLLKAVKFWMQLSKANEAINSSLKSSRGGVVHKLDIQKANNHVIWP